MMRRWKKIMALCFAFLMSFVMFGSSVEAANGPNEQDWSSAYIVIDDGSANPKQLYKMCIRDRVYAAIAGAGRSLGYVNAPGLFQRVCALCANETSDISVYETNKNILTKGLRDRCV